MISLGFWFNLATETAKKPKMQKKEFMSSSGRRSRSGLTRRASNDVFGGSDLELSEGKLAQIECRVSEKGREREKVREMMMMFLFC